MPGVRNVKVNFDAKEAYVTFDPKKAVVANMSAALKKAGFGGQFKKPGRP